MVVTVPSGNTRTGRWGEGGGYAPQVTYRYVVDGVEHGPALGYLIMLRGVCSAIGALIAPLA